MSNQQDINSIRAQRPTNTHDPLALMENTQTPFHPDQSSHITYIQHPQSNNKFVLQPSFNTNYVQQPMQNPKDISDPTTALDMALELMSKAFQLNNITPINNNQRSSSKQSILGKPPSSSKPKLYSVTPFPKSTVIPKVDVKSTTRTRRPQPRNNPKSDKVPFKSKSSCLSNKLEKIEENHRSFQSSNNLDHTSSECNNIKLAIRNEKSEVICATCKQCLITANHDDCVLQYVNG
ncbi:hypothetical protein Tco_1421743 [Tanacetum coccineum]